MMKKLLVALGLRKAPAPIRSYVGVASIFGTIPAIAWVAWKNRDRIRSFVGGMRQHQQPAGALAAAAAQ